MVLRRAGESMRRAPKAWPPINVRVTKDGKEHEGEYNTTRDLVTVQWRQSEVYAAWSVRREHGPMLLRELVDEVAGYSGA